MHLQFNSLVGRECLISVPKNGRKVCSMLRAYGFQAWAVGGWVRDSLMGRYPKDLDITTDATPKQVQEAFVDYRVIPTGIDYGTVMVMIDGEGYEVTTFRLDGDYDDGRRPVNVEYTTDLMEDLMRRDFSVNTFSYDPIDSKLVSVEGAMSDLERGMIRAVGTAKDRFVGPDGDALRMLRACRFAATLNFVIEEGTLRAMHECAPCIKNVSMERIRDEILKIEIVNKERRYGGMLTADRPSIAFDHMLDTGLLKFVLPELVACVGVEQPSRYHIHDVYHHIMAVLDAVPKEAWLVRLMALMHDIGKPAHQVWSEEKQRYRFLEHEISSAELAETILGRLKFPTDIIKTVIPVVRHHMTALRLSMGRVSNKALRKMVNRVGEDNLEYLFILSKADVRGSGVNMEDGLKNIQALRDRIAEMAFETGGKAGFKIADMNINGHDIMGMGVEQGPMVGKLLARLHEAVLEDPFLNNKETLTRMAGEMVARNVSKSG